MIAEEFKKYLEEKLKEIITKSSFIILTGSRALNVNDKKSDYDCYLVLKNAEYKNASDYFIKKDWCLDKKAVWTNFTDFEDTQVTLILKRIEDIENEKFVDLQYAYLNSKLIIGNKKIFSEILKKLEKNIDFDSELKRKYLECMMALSVLRGMARRKITFEVNSNFKKGDAIRNFMQTVILIDKKIYPYEKWLNFGFKKSKNYKSAKKYIKKIEEVKSYKSAVKLRLKIRDYLTEVMPKEEYVGENWWRHN